MIGKLGEDEKANWLSHLAEIALAYNATQSAMTGYSPHYLMFGCQPRLPVNFYFLTLRSAEGPRRGTSTRHVNENVATVRDHLRTTLQEAQAQSMAEAQKQKQYYDWKIGAVGLKPGDLILVKVDAFQGKRKIKDRWEGKPHKVVHQITTEVPLYEVKNQPDIHMSCIATSFSSLHGIPLCVVVCQAWDRCTSPTQVKPTPEGVTVRQCHKSTMVWQSPSIRLGRLHWGG